MATAKELQAKGTLQMQAMFDQVAAFKKTIDEVARREEEYKKQAKALNALATDGCRPGGTEPTVTSWSRLEQRVANLEAQR